MILRPTPLSDATKPAFASKIVFSFTCSSVYHFIFPYNPVRDVLLHIIVVVLLIAIILLYDDIM